jgi:23S rRNA pseudouridine1911/1915/1917 synthase
MTRPDVKLEILWQSSDAVALAKPAGLTVIPGRGETTSLLEQLALQLRLPWTGTSDPRVRIVHRLDKDTSGVLLVATHIDMQRHLSHQFQNNTIEKEYLALVAGRPSTEQGEIDAPLAPHPTQRKKMAIARHRGRPARTLWKIEVRFRDYTLLRVFPKTGKTHQIRVHLQSIGLPLAIDPLYNPTHGGRPGIFLSSFKRGYRSTDQDERPLIHRLTLHAHRLSFLNRDGNRITIEAPIPKDLRATLNMLAKYSRA